MIDFTEQRLRPTDATLHVLFDPYRLELHYMRGRAQNGMRSTTRSLPSLKSIDVKFP
jgi:hypothetical protein